MIICGIDVETTGLDCERDVITEIGAILWDTELNAPVRFFNKLIKIDRPVPAEIVELTGITDHLLSTYGEVSEYVWRDFEYFTSCVDHLMAHNAPFDKGFVSKQIPGFADINWIDSSVDVEYPKNIKQRSMLLLAAEHKFVNPFAHRALTDVMTMFQIVSKYDWNQTIKNSQTPSVTLRAMVTYGDNAKAKTLSYRWDGKQKFWLKQVKINKLDAEIQLAQDAGFLARRIGD